MTLTIYNTKNHTQREVVVVPSRKWPGEGMLGATIRFDSYEDCDDQLVHVLEVEVNSPAEIAGLQAGSDYLLGTLEKVRRKILLKIAYILWFIFKLYTDLQRHRVSVQ